MRRIRVLIMAVFMIAIAAPAQAGGGGSDNLDTIEIPVSTVIRASEGSQHVLASKTVADDLVGANCSVMATAKNQSSVHPGNDLVVASNGTSVVLEDVERAPGVSTPADGTLTLGEDITVTLIMGADEVFSAGITVKVECDRTPIPECPTGTDPLAKFEWKQGWKAEFGDDVVSVNGDATSGTWTSTEPVDALVVKAARDHKILEFDNALSGTYNNDGLTTPNGKNVPDISFLLFCGGEEEEPIETSVSISGECRLVEDQAQGFIDAEVGEGAILSIDGESFGPGSYDDLTVVAPGTYPWVAEATEGYVLVGETSGEIVIEDCSEQEVIETSVSVTSSCEIVDDKGVGLIEFSVGEGALLMIDSVDNFGPGDGSVNVEPGTYTWSATAEDGYVLVGNTLGEEVIEDCTPEMTTTTTEQETTTTQPSTTTTEESTTSTAPATSTTMPPPDGDWPVNSERSQGFPVELLFAGLVAVVASGMAVWRLRHDS